MVISHIRYQGKYFSPPVNFSLSQVGLFVLVSGQWSFVCQNQLGLRVTAAMWCDLFSAGLRLPLCCFPTPMYTHPASPRPAPRVLAGVTWHSVSYFQLWGWPWINSAGASSFPSFFTAVSGPCCWLVQGGWLNFDGGRVPAVSALFRGGLPSGVLATAGWTQRLGSPGSCVTQRRPQVMAVHHPTPTWEWACRQTRLQPSALTQTESTQKTITDNRN